MQRQNFDFRGKIAIVLNQTISTDFSCFDVTRAAINLGHQMLQQHMIIDCLLPLKMWMEAVL